MTTSAETNCIKTLATNLQRARSRKSVRVNLSTAVAARLLVMFEQQTALVRAFSDERAVRDNNTRAWNHKSRLEKIWAVLRGEDSSSFYYSPRIKVQEREK